MRRVLPLLLGLLVLAGCSTSKDAVATGAQEFTFVAPGGQTTILYDPPSSRGVAPNLSGESLMNDGAQVGLDDYAGRVVVVNIWGSWCGPCRTEAPDLEFVAQQSAAAGVSVLGIDVRDYEKTAAQDFVRDRGLTYDSIYDPYGRSLAALSGYPRNVVPSTLVLDRQHRVAAVYLTVIRPSDLLSTVQRVAAEPVS
ncbi:TlpA disulfide reductase family protein [Pseudonocardia sp. WMMC193]|uniref:TlpA disulfide reductase family protein n=1 Tax=Pseudonocardia sp. WMMC193 TaxID=2911965 RepID=UPI001F40FA78|nr:TlpA disulfide reductase family protein [Pseudonocardia sp. WMMC193]MCF7552946.1 TlpA family protein disulfide reductase [Pseudonocardia sp. WMMC193]